MLHIVSVWLHIVASVLWIGGMAFLSLVFVPAVRAGSHKAEGAELLRISARRFQGIVLISIGLLLGTGWLNIVSIGRGPGLATPFGRILSLKLALVAVMLALTGFHSLAARGLVVRSPRFAAWLPRLNLLLGLGVLLCAVALGRSGP